MRLEDFYKLYEEDLKPKMKLNTWRTKDVIFQKKLIPYFKDKKINEISSADIGVSINLVPVKQRKYLKKLKNIRKNTSHET